MQIKYRDSRFFRQFGVEIEVGPEVPKKDIGVSLIDFECRQSAPRLVFVEDGPKGWAESRGNEYWHVKYDGSCGPVGHHKDHGWEIASFVGKTCNDLKHISHGTQPLAEIGCKVNENCGLHVHVSARDFSSNQMAVLMARWLKCEPYILQSCPATRKNNKWCKPLRTRLPKPALKDMMPPLDTPDKFWLWMMPSNLNIHENHEKRVALNVINYTRGLSDPDCDRMTVELRLPDCCLDSCHIKNWALLFINFVESSVGKPFPRNLDQAESLQEALGYMGLMGEDEFFILDEDLYEAKLWLLNRIVRNGTHKKYVKPASDLIEYIGQI